MISFGLNRMKIEERGSFHDSMMKLVLVRHGESEWNKLNLFTGWTDVDLSEKGHEEAKAAGQLLKAEGYDFDVFSVVWVCTAISASAMFCIRQSAGSLS